MLEASYRPPVFVDDTAEKLFKTTEALCWAYYDCTYRKTKFSKDRFKRTMQELNALMFEASKTLGVTK